MVRSESADDEMIVIDKYDVDMEEDDFPPRTIWGVQSQNGAPRPLSRSASSLSPTSADPDRRLRRQIANCNERRRMQSINAGFQSLRALLPRKIQEGEKLSKAAILQQTADLIHQLQGERTRLITDRDGTQHGGKKPKMEANIMDMSDLEQRSMIDRLQCALERERSARVYLEQQLTQMRELYQVQNTLATVAAVQQPPTPPPQPPLPTPPQIITPTAVVVPPPIPQQQQSHEASVIRPTPLPPITVDVCSRVTVSHTTPSPLPLVSIQSGSNGMSSQGSAFSSSASLSAHRSLQTILDAIRHLEGGALVAPSPPPTSQAPLVR